MWNDWEVAVWEMRTTSRVLTDPWSTRLNRPSKNMRWTCHIWNKEHRGAKGTSKVLEQVAQISLFSPKSKLLHPCPSAHTCGSVGTLVWAAEGGEKRLSLLHRWVGSVCRYNLKVAAEWQPCLVIVWNTVVEESPPSGQSFSLYTWLSTLRGKKEA